ncbi:MAG: lipid A biosynthesis lauroyl acyltransferase [Gammaproteobacteria bacterium]|nr:MAG: lipid A biosynthesis lauroyl acyltransferase [Gammaproteobacteria bacterium]
MTDPAPRPAHAGRPPGFYVLRLPVGHLRPRYWGTWAALGLLRFGVLLPLGVARWLGSAWGWLFLLLNAKRRRIARINLAMCFPELSTQERRRLLRKHFVSVGKSYADLGFLAWASKPRLVRSIRLVGLEHLDDAARRGKNVILLIAHCLGVNYASIIARHHAMFSMFKPPHDAVVDWFLNKGRMRFGCALLSRHQGMRPVVRALQRGMALYYIPDEDFGPERSLFAPFFGVPTATLPTLGRLARMADAVVIPVSIRMLPGGAGHELTLSPALGEFPTGNPNDDAARMNAALEQSIRAAPEQYMWTFKLFKTRPDNGPSPYA